jgi:hypothetical protein
MRPLNAGLLKKEEKRKEHKSESKRGSLRLFFTKKKRVQKKEYKRESKSESS